MDKSTTISLTKAYLRCKVEEFKITRKDKGSFIISDILGSNWPRECVPFWKVYGERSKVAGAEMGKLLSKVAKDMGLHSMKENRFCKERAITRYFF